MSRILKSLFLLCIVSVSYTAVTFVSAQETMSPGLASKHQKFGVKCESCHGQKNEIGTPEKVQCIQCHNPADLKKPSLKEDPHNSPHYPDGLECTVCHVQHEKSVDYCSQCHNFNFKIP